MTTFEKIKRNTVVRVAKRGIYDQETIHQIIDNALICHVGFAQQGQPFVIPTIHARLDNNLLLHGSKASRMMRHIQTGNDICISITLLDGLVLARSVFHHSMNYRSVVLFGKGHLIENDDEKMRALEIFTEKLIPGRWADARQPTKIERQATSIVSIPIESASAKVRTGPPLDDDEDYQLPVWAGVLPITQQFGPPQADSKLSRGIPVPDYVRQYVNDK